MSNSLWPHKSQHARPPCPSPTPRVHSDSRPSSQWCHPVILSSVIPFSFCPQSLPASESFPMSQLFAWGGQSTGVSALASLLPTMAFAKNNKCKYTHSTLTHIPSPVFPRKNPPKWMTHFSYAEGHLCRTDRWVKSVHTLDGETGNSSIFKTLN